MARGKIEPIGNPKPVKQQNIDKSSTKDLKNKDNLFNEIQNSNIDIDDENLDCNIEATNDYYKEKDIPLPHNIISDEKGCIDVKQDVSVRVQLAKGKVIISQSLIKQLINRFQEEIPFCPKYIKDVVMDRKYEGITSEPMLKGKFFETLCLGSSTHGTVTDLPRKKLSQKKINELKAKGKPILGEKSIDQIRLETQAERFKIKAKQLQTEIFTGVNTHVTILKKWDDKYILAGELDWFPTPIFYEGALRLAMIDIKSTGNIQSTFGDFGWGNPENMDHLQQDMYHYLVRDIDFELNPHLKNVVTERTQEIINNNDIIALYWVWGYQKEPLEDQEKIIERLYQERPGSDYRQKELKERIRKAIYILEREEAFGWDENPIYDMCKKCPMSQNLGGNCESSIIVKV